MRRSSLIACVLTSFCLSYGCAGAENAPPPQVVQSTTEHDGPTAKQLVSNGARLIDVRSADEYAQSHIEGAENFPVDGIEASDLGPKDRSLVVYCGSGKRAARAAGTLRSKGYTHVYELGAMSNWPK